MEELHSSSSRSMFVTWTRYVTTPTSQERRFTRPGHIEMTVLMHHPLHEDCRKVSQILARIGEKWSMLVVMLLRDGPRRFNDIKRNTGGISQQMWTRTLRGLERDGMVTRTIFPTSPPQVEYSLTALAARCRSRCWRSGNGSGPISSNSTRPA